MNKTTYHVHNSVADAENKKAQYAAEFFNNFEDAARRFDLEARHRIQYLDYKGAGRAYANEAQCLNKIGKTDEAVAAFRNAHSNFIAAWDETGAKEVESAVKALERPSLV